MNIIFCGMPMSGKSTLGAALALKLGRNFIDTDVELEKTYANAEGEKLSCREISIRLGEQAFRHREKLVIKELLLTTNSVIATGGGSLCDPENIQMLKSIGILIYLQVHVEVLVERLKQKTNPPSYLNPLDLKASLQELSKHRCLIYEKSADIHFDVSSENTEEMISRVCTLLK